MKRINFFLAIVALLIAPFLSKAQIGLSSVTFTTTTLNLTSGSIQINALASKTTPYPQEQMIPYALTGATSHTYAPSLGYTIDRFNIQGG